MKKNKKAVQMLSSFLLLGFTFAVVLIVGLNGNELKDLSSALQRISPVFLLLCVASWGLYVLFNALTMYHFLRVQGYPMELSKNLRAAMIGIYYCNVTPGATGGQPMEMYALSKYGIPVGVSGSGMAVKFLVFQTVLLVTGAVLWSFNREFVRENAPNSWWFILIGYLANFFTIGMVMLMAISKKAVRFVIEVCIRAGEKIRICKSPSESRERWENYCSSFLASIQFLLNKPFDLLIQALIAFGHLMSLMLVIVAVYHAFGLTAAGDTELIAMGVLLYIGASYTPLPGASGAQEGGFAAMFRCLFPDAVLFIALMIWRFSTYYLSVLAGVVITVSESFASIRKCRKIKKV